MRYVPFRWLAPAGLLLCFASVQAQSNVSARQPDPNDPLAKVPATPYQSSFKNYRNLREEPMSSWKDSNDLVGRIGGWRVYAREVAEPQAPASAPSSNKNQPTAPNPSGRGDAGVDHKGHK